MFDTLHQGLYAHQLLVLGIALPIGLIATWRFVVALRASLAPAAAPAPQTRRTQKVVQQQVLERQPTPPAVVQGTESRIAKAVEATIRVGTDDQRPETKPAHDTQDLLGGSKTSVSEEVNQLFAGLDDQLKPETDAQPAPTPAVRPSKPVMVRATRLEQLGFHHSIEPAKDAKAPAAAPALSAPPAPPQLDDILARLDKVLGEDSSAVPTPTSPPAAAAEPPPPPKAPLWARSDATDEDLSKESKDPGKQLGLFDGGSGPKP